MAYQPLKWEYKPQIIQSTSIKVRYRYMGSITYITGARDAGKTTLIKEVASGMPDAIGVIAEKCFDSDGSVAGYDAVLIPSGQRLPQCRRFENEVFTQRHGGFWFDMSVFFEVHEYILKNLEPGQTVIIDEIGNLEMRHHGGYYPTLVALMQQPEINLILALRG